MEILDKDTKNKAAHGYIGDCAAAIEQSLEALGFSVRVREVKVSDHFYEYFLEVALGVDVNELEKHDRDVALAVASPTGKVEWQIPVPGKSLIGIKVPRIPDKKPKVKPVNDEAVPVKRNLRMRFADIFYAMGRINFNIAQRIIGIK